MDQSASLFNEENAGEILHDFPPLIRVYKDGRIVRILGTATVPAGLDPETGVDSKDVIVSDHVPVRLYLPKLCENKNKVPLLVYFHGGGFCIESASSPSYHTHLNLLASKAGIVVVSVDYRRAPEHPLPAAFDDSWTVLQWVQSNAVLAAAGEGGESWLTDHVDFTRVFLAGDSAGATIAHRMGIQAGAQGGLPGIRLGGIVLAHPYFGGKKPIPGDEHINEAFWRFVCPGTSDGLDDPWINPAMDKDLKLLGTDRLLILVAEKDFLRARGVLFKETLDKSGWQGEAELVEFKDQGHVFHLLFPDTDAAAKLVAKVISFINHPASSHSA